jgi:predicted phage gp36 major capsid-like protein
MADEQTNKKGGFHFGPVGGDVEMKAGGDIVGGDKNTTTTIQIQRGFAAEDQKQQFQAQIDQLREVLRAVKAQIEASPSLNDDQKEEAAGEILQHVKALKEVKEKTAALPAGKQAPADVGSLVDTTLNPASGILDKLQSLAKTTGDVAGKVGEFAGKYGPLIASARHLFGLP